MGFQTVVGIQNDYWHEVQEDPQKFVNDINEGMTIRSSNNKVKIYPSHHADFPHLYISWGNMFIDIGSKEFQNMDLESKIKIRNKMNEIISRTL